jgi:hypothetical protein
MKEGSREEHLKPPADQHLGTFEQLRADQGGCVRGGVGAVHRNWNTHSCARESGGGCDAVTRG